MRKNTPPITLKTLFIELLKIFFYGSVLLIIISIITFNNKLVYPSTEEGTRMMLIQIIILGVLGKIVVDSYMKKKNG